jgi:hypothetical protein
MSIAICVDVLVTIHIGALTVSDPKNQSLSH